MLKRLPTILIVTAVALAIWIVAEAESIRSETFNPVIAIDSAGAAGLMARADPTRNSWPSRFVVTAEGSAGALDALGRALDDGVELAPGRGLRLEPGTHTLDLRQALASLESVVQSGATISAVEPPTVVVEIAEQDSIELPIELVRNGLSLDGDPIIRPDRVKITGPREYIDRLTSESHALVELRAQDLAALIPGRSETITNVPVRLPTELRSLDFWGSTPADPTEVSVTLNIRDQVDSFTVRSVTVLLAVAPVDYNDWDVIVSEQSRVLRDVHLTGPSDIIGQFERGELRVDAFVRLTFQDLEDGVALGTITRDAIIGPLPPGVTYECEDTKVELQVRQRQTVPASPPDEPTGTPDT